MADKRPPRKDPFNNVNFDNDYDADEDVVDDSVDESNDNKTPSKGPRALLEKYQAQDSRTQLIIKVVAAIAICILMVTIIKSCESGKKEQPAPQTNIAASQTAKPLPTRQKTPEPSETTRSQEPRTNSPTRPTLDRPATTPDDNKDPNVSNLPRRMDEDGDPFRYQPPGNLADNNTQDNDKAARISVILDSVVNNTDPTLAGFDKLQERLQTEGVEADASIQHTYQMLQYMTDAGIAFNSRATQPDLYPTTKSRVYEVTYEVAGAGVPVDGDSYQALRERVGFQMEEALNAGVIVPVTFVIDLDQKLVSINQAQWW